LRAYKILLANKDKNFVDRIINKDKYPVMDLGDGSYATHQMAWGDVDGKYYVFPTILYNGKSLYKPDNPFQDAMKSGEFIEFSSPEEADWFSKNYKLVWGNE